MLNIGGHTLYRRTTSPQDVAYYVEELACINTVKKKKKRKKNVEKEEGEEEEDNKYEHH